jgi:two-component sensor histidine kinase
MLSPLRSRLFRQLGSASLLAMLPIAAALAYQASVWRAEAISSGTQTVIHETEAIRADIRGIFEAAEETLQFVANSPAVRRRDWATCEEFVTQLARNSKRTAFMGVVDADGNLLCASVPSPRPVSVADRLFFRAVREKLSFSIGEYAIGRSSGRPSIHASYPLMRDGAFAGAVNMGLDVQWLADRISGSASNPDAMIYVLDRAGLVLATMGSLSPGIGEEIGDLLPPDGAATGEPNVVETIALGGVERLVHVTPVVEAPGGTIWVAVAIDKAELVSAADRAFAVAIAVYLLATLAGLLTLWYFLSRLVVWPVTALNQAAQNIREGNISDIIGLPKRGANEVADLVSTFQEMAGAVAARDKDRSELERKDALLREVSHRVKNHLAGIASMTRLESRNAASSNEDALESMHNRIMAVADLYDLLARRPDSGQISLAEYVEVVCGQLAAVIGQDGIKIHTRLQGNAQLAPDRAMALGLLVNEIITNAAKHAFPTGVGRINVEMDARSGEVLLTVSDDGVGLDEDAEETGLGAAIIQSLAIQLDASLVVSSDRGTAYSLSFQARLPTQDA